MPVTCANCGAKVSSEEERCPECSAPLKVVCPNCGAYVSVDEDECPDCDESLAHGTQGV